MFYPLKNIFLQIFLLLFVLFLVPLDIYGANEHIKEITLVVLPFNIDSQLRKECKGEAVSILFENSLSSKVKLVTRTRLNKLLYELKFQQSDCVEKKKQLKLGHFLEADQIVIGSLDIIGGFIIVTAQRLDIQSGEIIGMGAVRILNLDLLPFALNEVAILLLMSSSEKKNYVYQLNKTAPRIKNTINKNDNATNAKLLVKYNKILSKQEQNEIYKHVELEDNKKGSDKEYLKFQRKIFILKNYLNSKSSVGPVEVSWGIKRIAEDPVAFLNYAKRFLLSFQNDLINTSIAVNNRNFRKEAKVEDIEDKISKGEILLLALKKTYRNSYRKQSNLIEWAGKQRTSNWVLEKIIELENQITHMKKILSYYKNPKNYLKSLHDLQRESHLVLLKVNVLLDVMPDFHNKEEALQIIRINELLDEFELKRKSLKI